MEVAIICLGANGDIINALPIARDESKKGHSVTMVVSNEYEGILDGVSFVQKIALDLHYSKPRVAYDYAKSLGRFNRILIAQTYGTGVPAQTDSFQKEAYRCCNRLNDFGKLDFVFDKRSPQRELDIVSKFPSEKPWIVYNGEGRSSPFPHKQDLESLICSFSDQYNIINIGTVRAERFFDLLGFYDRGSVLVTIDSGPLHLATCSNVPVISLITDKPTPWYGAIPPKNSICSVRYSEYPQRKAEIWEALKRVNPIDPKVSSQKKIFHVYSEFQAKGETGRRNAFASSTWNNEYQNGNWVALPTHDSELFRSSKNVGDHRGVPFIKDLVNKAADLALDEDLIVLTNRDTCFSSGLTEAILSTMLAYPGLSAHRYDFHHPLYQLYTPNQAILGNWYCGCDLFCFTRKFWLDHRDEYPDMFLGTEAWDWIMRELIKKYGGVDIHYGLIYHEFHPAYWYQPSVKNSNPAQKHNVSFARKFLMQNRLPLNELS